MFKYTLPLNLKWCHTVMSAADLFCFINCEAADICESICMHILDKIVQQCENIAVTDHEKVKIISSNSTLDVIQVCISNGGKE